LGNDLHARRVRLRFSDGHTIEKPVSSYPKLYILAGDFATVFEPKIVAKSPARM